MTEAAAETGAALRVAYGSIPKEGGTFTFFRNHRQPLAEAGVDLRCVTIGSEQNALWDPRYADPHCVRIAPSATALRAQVEAFIAWCDEERIDVVIPVSSRAMNAAIPHLPADIRVVARCANALHDEYMHAASHPERVSAVVALTPRLAQDLTALHGVDPDRIHLIPNGVESGRFAPRGAPPRPGRPLRLGFLGRLEHGQKGVMFLPAVVDALRRHDVPFELTIAGQGVDEQALRSALQPSLSSGQAAMRGLLSREEVAPFLAGIDALLFPSRFEGCPNVLLEGMAAGCVPVCWTLPGITDFLVDEGRTGLLHPLGDTAAMADSLRRLASEPTTLRAISEQARAEAVTRFSTATCASEYAALLKTAPAAAEPEPLPLSRFRPAAHLERRMAWIPEPLRAVLRSARRRLTRSAPTR